MPVFLLIGTLLGSALTIFALQNGTLVTVSFLEWQLTAPMAFVLALFAAATACATMLALLPSLLSGEKRLRALRARERELGHELSKYRITIPIAPYELYPASPTHTSEYAKVVSR